MKSLVCSDLHLSIYSNDKVNAQTGLSERLSGIVNSMNYLSEFAKNNKIKNIIMAGDINHNKSIIYSIAQSILLDYVRKNNDLFFYIINGNHDMSSKSKGSISCLKSLDSENNVKMIHYPETIENIAFIPWSLDIVNDVKTNSQDFLISHFGLNEAELSSGISIVSDLKLSDLENYKQVILGHYHKPQEVGNVCYCGSLTQLDWGEKHEDKRFLVIDTDNGDIDSIESCGYKKFYSFVVNKENFEETITEGKKLQDEGHNVVFEKVESVDTYSFEKDFKFIDKTEKDITNRGISSSMSKYDVLNTYLDINEIDENLRKKYINIGMEIINSSEEKI